MKRVARSIALALVVSAGTVSSIASAQDAPVDPAAEARSQYQQGTQAFQQKRYAEAAVHFEAAAAYRVNAVTLYTAGLAWDLASRSERAADAFARALEVPGLDAKQTQTAKDRLAQLEKSLGTLTVTGPEGTKVQLDQFSEAPVPARLHAAPGVHTLSIRMPGKPIERKDVTLEIGKTTSYEVKEEVKPEEPAPPPPPPAEPEPTPPPPPPPPPFWTLRRVIGVGVGGVGLAALGATAVLGINANGAKDAYDAGPTREGFDHASSLETWTNVMLVSGAVLLAGGVALVLVPEKNDASVRVSGGPGSVVVGGTF